MKLPRENSAVTLKSDVTLVSLRVAVITPSDQRTKLHPAFGTAVTSVPSSPVGTPCMLAPVIVPPAPAVYVRVYPLAKRAVTVTGCGLSGSMMSTRGLSVLPSDQPVNTYPLSGTARISAVA